MRRHPLQILWLGLGFALLLGALPLKQHLKQQQVQDDLSFVGDAGTPPELSIAMGMGVFRSVILNALWMRASTLQQEGRFYEIVQLYDLIGKLQPHNARVWAFSSWNMAYNISVECPPGEERWRWVNHGLDRLLRHGLKYNPYDLELYKQAAWIYSHKIGKNLDDAHLYYKTKLCEKVMEVTASRDFNATATLKQLQSDDEAIKKNALNLQQALKRELGMELTMMSELEQDPYLGPLDWRLAQVQAIYWARKGLKNNKFQKKVIDLERLVYQAQQHLLRQGNLIYRAATDKLPASITTWSDYRQALPMQAMFERQIDLFEQHGSTSSGVLSAYRAFIDEAINLCIISGQDQLAQTLVDRVFEKRPDLLPQRNAKDLMRRQMKEQLKSMGGDEFSSLVSSLMMRHFWWKANGDPKKSNALLRHAQQVWLLNSKKNSVGERSTNRSLKALQHNVLLGIFQRKWFHPDVLSKLKVSLSQEQLQWLQEGLKN